MAKFPEIVSLRRIKCRRGFRRGRKAFWSGSVGQKRKFCDDPMLTNPRYRHEFRSHTVAPRRFRREFPMAIFLPRETVNTAGA